MTQNEVSIIKNAVLDCTEAYVDARLSVLDYVKTQIGVVQSVSKNSSNKYEHTVICNQTSRTSGIRYTKVLSIGNIEFPARSVVFLLAPNAQYSNQFILGKLDDTTFRVDSIAIGGTANNPAFTVDTQGNLKIGGTASNPVFSVTKDGVMTANQGIFKGSINVNNTFMVSSDGTMQATQGYIGSSTQGFIIGSTQIWTVGGPSNINNTWDGAGLYLGYNGLRVNANYATTGIVAGDITEKDGSNNSVSLQGGKLTVTNSGVSLISQVDNATWAFYRGDGARYVAWSSGSDERLKENIKPINVDSIRDLFNDLNPVQFNFIDDKEKKTEYGLIAQEFEKSLNKANLKDSNLIGELPMKERYKFISYEKIIGLLIPAVKDLYKQIEDLKIQIKELQNG